ncbi:hypothetical protein NBN67_09905 [Clostridioides difficile]|uniref:hypothetical protein n=1 Tax=Clostridioides difficile TaxID=1496 RepID=UPI00202F7C45|nr:hypothetical protein [Clostridioides difficile]MCM0737852.1 hypothetical protein [Clostridioides difficile]
MSLYYKEHKIKRRGGVYSEQNIFPSQVEFTSWDDKNFNQNCIAYFDNLSSEKNIGIRGNKELSKQSTRIVVKDNPSMQVPPTIQFEIRPIVTLIENPVIQFDSNSEKHISGACTIKYKIIDNEPNERFIITEKLENKVIAIKSNNVNNNTANDYSINLTDEQIAPLTIGKLYYVTIEISTEAGGLVGSYSYSFTRVNAKPVVEVNSYNSTSAKFIVSDLDNNLSKIEWYLDDVLKETITTDLTTEKTINYELTDNAIHTLKIIATDAENATAEKVLSISKEIMPLQSDATLQDISSKLVEIGEGFRNGKTSIINTLALKNIEASLNNTLVELSEKIKTSFDSGDASVQDLMNQLTQANNTINQLNSKYKYASGTVYQRENTLLYACLYDPNSSHSDKIVRPDYWFDFNGIGFIPDLFFAELDYQPNSDKIFKYFVFVVRNIPSISNNSGFVVNIIFNKTYGQTTFSIIGELFALGKSHVYMNNNGIRVPVPYSLSNSPYNWHAIKFA